MSRARRFLNVVRLITEYFAAEALLKKKRRHSLDIGRWRY